MDICAGIFVGLGHAIELVFADVESTLIFGLVLIGYMFLSPDRSPARAVRCASTTGR